MGILYAARLHEFFLFFCAAKSFDLQLLTAKHQSRDKRKIFPIPGLCIGILIDSFRFSEVQSSKNWVSSDDV